MVISYFLGTDSLYAFVLNNNGLEVFRASYNRIALLHQANKLKRYIDATINIAESHVPEKFYDHYDSTLAVGQKLYYALLGWDNMQTYLENAAVTFIVPDHILYGLPFSCLCRSITEKPDFLIQRTALVDIPCAEVSRVDPYHDKNSISSHTKVVYSINPKLPGANKLIKLIKDQFPLAEQLQINDLHHKKKDVMTQLNKYYDVYILCGHSTPNFVIPDSSIFQLTAQSQNDSIHFMDITASDLREVTWSNASMVMLVGCETARGKFYEGTGNMGLKQVLMCGGAKQVISNLWQIDAHMTLKQMETFLTLWSKETEAAFALQAVQTQTIEKMNGNFYFKKPQPYLWSNFLLTQY
jgi:CHAT domain-containing protein